MNVTRFKNKLLSSNSYVIDEIYSDKVWVIDPGDSDNLLTWVKNNKKEIKGILLTHAHIDHIYGVNDLCENFVNIKIFASNLALKGLYSAKVNGSFYMENPYVINHDKIEFVNENDKIELFENKLFVEVVNTPGHDDDCVSYSVDNYLFTGDALIPGVKIPTRSKTSNRIAALESINKILNNFNSKTIICPGHGDIEFLGLIEIPDINT